MTETIDWQEIHGLVFTDQPGCWTTCGSYCCTHKHDDLAFSLLGADAGMIFFEREYEWLKARGVLQQGFEAAAKLWRVPIREGLELRFYTSKCSLKGMCSLPSYRPVCCKIYPFVPRYDLETSEPVGYFNGMVFDHVLASIGTPSPCTLVRDKADEVKGQARAALRRLSQEPYLLFYVKVVEHFLDAVGSGTARLRAAMPQASKRELTKAWELKYLSRRLIDMNEFKENVARSYDVVKRRFPELRV